MGPRVSPMSFSLRRRRARTLGIWRDRRRHCARRGARTGDGSAAHAFEGPLLHRFARHVVCWSWDRRGPVRPRDAAVSFRPDAPLWPTSAPLGVSNSFLVALGVVALGFLVERCTRLGRVPYAIGNNEGVALLTGIPVARYCIYVYAIAGACSALARRDRQHVPWRRRRKRGGRHGVLHPRSHRDRRHAAQRRQRRCPPHPDRRARVVHNLQWADPVWRCAESAIRRLRARSRQRSDRRRLVATGPSEGREMSAATGQTASGRKSAAERPPGPRTGWRHQEFRTARRGRRSLPHYPPE